MNPYKYLFSKVLLFSSAINKDKTFAAFVACAIFSGFPILNLMVLLVNIYKVNYYRIRAYLIISFIMLYLINLIFLIFTRRYELIELENNSKTRKSKITTVTIVSIYILFTFIFLFVQLTCYKPNHRLFLFKLCLNQPNKKRLSFFLKASSCLKSG